MLAIVAVQTMTLTDPVAEASPKGLVDGFKVALQADTGGRVIAAKSASLNTHI